jgi:hypothetical protein
MLKSLKTGQVMVSLLLLPILFPYPLWCEMSAILLEPVTMAKIGVNMSVFNIDETTAC